MPGGAARSGRRRAEHEGSGGAARSMRGRATGVGRRRRRTEPRAVGGVGRPASGGGGRSYAQQAGSSDWRRAAAASDGVLGLQKNRVRVKARTESGAGRLLSPLQRPACMAVNATVAVKTMSTSP